MSLFDLRELWTHQLRGVGGKSNKRDGYGSGGNICTVPVQSDESTGHAVVVGSYTGDLHVLFPRSPSFDSPSNLLLSAKLDSPILQLQVLMDGINGQTLLAVLHPLSFDVHELIFDVRVTSASLRRVQSVSLPSTAFNFVNWTLEDSAFISVIQLLSSDLVVVEQASIAAYVSVKPNPDSVALPGPMAYCRATNSVLVGSCDFTINSLALESMLLASSDLTSAADAPPVTPSWTLGLGELVTAIDVVDAFSNAPGDSPVIVALGTESIFVLLDTGKLYTTLPCDSKPVALTSYRKGNQTTGLENLLVLLADGVVQLFEDGYLIWNFHCCTVERTIALAVAPFFSMPRLVLLLSPNGRLSIGCLGTDTQLTGLQVSLMEPETVFSKLRLLNKQIQMLEHEKEKHSNDNADESLRELAPSPGGDLSIGPVRFAVEWTEISNPFAKRLKSNSRLKIAAFKYRVQPSGKQGSITEGTDAALTLAFTVCLRLRSRCFTFENGESSMQLELGDVSSSLTADAETFSGKVYVCWAGRNENLPASYGIEATGYLAESNAPTPRCVTVSIDIPKTSTCVWLAEDSEETLNYPVCLDFSLDKILESLQALFPDFNLVPITDGAGRLLLRVRGGKEAATVALGEGGDTLRVCCTTLGAAGLICHLLQSRLLPNNDFTLASSLPISHLLETLHSCYDACRSYQGDSVILLLELQRLKVLEKLLLGNSLSKVDGANQLVEEYAEKQCSLVQNLLANLDSAKLKVQTLEEQAIAELKFAFNLVLMHPSLVSAAKHGGTHRSKVLSTISFASNMLESWSAISPTFFLPVTVDSTLCFLQLARQFTTSGGAKSTSAPVNKDSITVYNQHTGEPQPVNLQPGLPEFLYALLSAMLQMLTSLRKDCRGELVVPMYLGSFTYLSSLCGSVFAKLLKRQL